MANEDGRRTPGPSLTTGILIGIVLGVPIGLATGNLAIGIPIGVALGIAMSSSRAVVSLRRAGADKPEGGE
jgi:Mg/Co/Ni transporter MgtE